jgi:hypothetical protein
MRRVKIGCSAIWCSVAEVDSKEISISSANTCAIIDIFAPYRDTDISAETYQFSMSMRYILNNEKTRKLPSFGV